MISYICHTPYHLLIAIIKVLTNNTMDARVIICNKNYIGEDTIGRLIKAGIFTEVICHEDIDSYSRQFHSTNNVLKRRHIMQEAERIIDIELLDTDNFYIFNDDSTYGILLNIKHIRYHLIEDGLDCFKGDYFIRRNKIKKTLSKSVQRLFGIYADSFGDSEYMYDIEVNDANDIHVGKARNIIQKNRVELFGGLTDFHKGLILDIFLGDYSHMEFHKGNNAVLIITQPIDTGWGISETQKLSLYQKIVNMYPNHDIFIKVHPREDVTAYKKYFDQYCVLGDNRVPIEIYSFLPSLYFEIAVTIFSTAINAVTFAEKKVVLGKEWMLSHTGEYKG